MRTPRKVYAKLADPPKFCDSDAAINQDESIVTQHEWLQKVMSMKEGGVQSAGSVLSPAEWALGLQKNQMAADAKQRGWADEQALSGTLYPAFRPDAAVEFAST